jgi:hypothetical protein
MSRMLQVVLVIPCIFSHAVAATVSIGTISARGDMRIDKYIVNGNATLFDGSLVETGQASAILRLDKGTEIVMAAASRGALNRDRFILQQGKSELTDATSFQIEANGLHVTPSLPNSRGVVAMKPENTLEVAALTGSFGVTSERGILLANIRTGQSVSFAMQADGDSSACMGTGKISAEGGNYFITITSTSVKYELTSVTLARLLGDLVGKVATIKGTIISGATPAGGAAAAIALQNLWAPASRTSAEETVLIGGRLIVSGAIGPETGVSATNQPMIPGGVP